MLPNDWIANETKVHHKKNTHYSIHMQIITKFILRTLLVMCIVGLGVQFTHAQRTITGTVKDQETGELLIGVTLVEKESRGNGAVTDLDGNFTIKVSDRATALIVNYTGYQETEQSIAGTNTVQITMSTSAILKEVVVIGYGTVKREDATGLVQTVSTDKFNRGAITSPQELLAGKVAGVVITTDGSPGGGSQIRIRGESSLTASKDPLIVIDGVPVETSGLAGNRNVLNLINPNDIETFTVLKDASAAAIYGNRASGGVIIITTKKGALGKKIRVDYNVNVSSGQTAGRIDVLTADEFRAAMRTNYAADHPSLKLLGNASTDWQDEIYQSAFGQDHNLSLSGGVGMVPYRVSLGYTNKDGLLKTDNFSRYTMGVNLNPKFLNNRLQLNLGFKGMLSDNKFADKGAIGAALSFDPTQQIRQDTSERFGGYTTWLNTGNSNPNALATTNPLALLNLTDDNSTVNHYITNATIDYRFAKVPQLRYNLNLAYDRSNGSGTKVIPNFASFSFNNLTGGGVNNTYEETKTNALLETYVNYKETFGGVHDIDLLVGYSWQEFTRNKLSINSDAAGTIENTLDDYDGSELVLLSMFTRLNYTFKDRYLLTASVRRDGTSRFAPEHRWGNFPAIAAAVKVIENKNKYFNSLKVRTSWGITGQQAIGNDYAYLPTYQVGLPTVQYQFGSNFDTIIRPNGYAYDIKWEQTSSTNIGVDFSIINDRLSGSVDVYQRNTSDMLTEINFAALSNLTNVVVDNAGKMTTKGIEASLNITPIKTKSARWDISTNMAYNFNRVKLLTNIVDSTKFGLETGGIAGGVGNNIQIHTVDYAPSSFFVREQLYDENGNILEGQFADRNGDGKFDNNDRYRYRQPAPLYSFGISSNLTISNFDFSFAGRAFLGNYVYNNIQTDMGFLNRLYQPTNYLQNINQSAVDLNVKEQSKLTFSDHFVTDASFFRIDHITAGYNFQSLIGKYLRLYATIQNPLVITKYTGLDPEISNGIDNSVYPRPRTYLVGVSVSF